MNILWSQLRVISLVWHYVTNSWALVGPNDSRLQEQVVVCLRSCGFYYSSSLIVAVDANQANHHSGIANGLLQPIYTIGFPFSLDLLATGTN